MRGPRAPKGSERPVKVRQNGHYGPGTGGEPRSALGADGRAGPRPFPGREGRPCVSHESTASEWAEKKNMIHFEGAAGRAAGRVQVQRGEDAEAGKIKDGDTLGKP